MSAWFRSVCPTCGQTVAARLRGVPVTHVDLATGRRCRGQFSVVAS